MDGQTVGEAKIKLRFDTKGAASEAEGDLKSSVKKMAGVVASAFVIKKGIDFFGGAIKNAEEAQIVTKQTAAVLKSTGQIAGVSAGQVSELADSISRKTGIDDEAIQSGENLLLTFTKVRNEVGEGNDIFNQATETIVDMSAALGTDAKSSAIQLGKALNDPIKGVTALQRVGVSFTAQQKEQIKTMVQNNDTLGAQKLILKELQTEFGGSAEATATSSKKMSVAIDNVKESIGAGLLPIIEPVADGITNIAQAFSALPRPAQSSIVGITTLVLAIKPLITIGKFVKGSLDDIGKGMEGLAGKVGGSNSKFSKFTSTLGLTAGNALPILGTALVAGGFLFDQWQKKSRDAKKQADAFKQAVQDEGSAVGGLNKIISESVLNDNDLQDALDTTGLSAKKFAELVRKGASDMDYFTSTGTKSNGELKILQREFGLSRSEAEKYSGALRTLGEKGTDLSRQFQDYNKTAKTANAVSKELGVTSEYEAAQIGEVGEAADVAGLSVKTFKEEIDKALGVSITADEATIRYKDSVKSLADSFKENGNVIGFNTQKQRDNKAALLDTITSIFDEGDALAKSGRFADGSAAQHQYMKNRLIELKKQFPFLKDEIDGYIRKLGKIPKDVATKVTISSVFDDAGIVRLKAKLDGVITQYGGDSANAAKIEGIYRHALVKNQTRNKQQKKAGQESKAGDTSNRAVGGTIYPGRNYNVNDSRGMEIGAAWAGGHVANARETARLIAEAMGGNGGVKINNYLSGFGMNEVTQELNEILKRSVALYV
jgi:hypothetical protein